MRLARGRSPGRQRRWDVACQISDSGSRLASIGTPRDSVGFVPPGTHGVSGLHEHGRTPEGFRQGVPVGNSGVPELRRPTELVGPFCGQATRRRQAGGRSSRRRHKWALPRCFTLSPIAALPSFKLGPFGDLKARGMHSGRIVQPGLWGPFPELALGGASIEPH